MTTKAKRKLGAQDMHDLQQLLTQLLAMRKTQRARKLQRNSPPIKYPKTTIRRVVVNGGDYL